MIRPACALLGRFPERTERGEEFGRCHDRCGVEGSDFRDEKVFGVQCHEVVHLRVLGGCKDRSIIGIDDGFSSPNHIVPRVVRKLRGYVLDEQSVSLDKLGEFLEEDAVGFDEDLVAEHDPQFLGFTQVANGRRSPRVRDEAGEQVFIRY